MLRDTWPAGPDCILVCGAGSVPQLFPSYSNGCTGRSRMCHAWLMRWAGEGSELWRVRVDLFSPDADSRLVSVVARSLESLLTGDDRDADDHSYGVDQGLGITERPVLGLVFWVRADDVGAAAARAVEVARDAGGAAGVGPDLYDVTVIPRDSVVAGYDPA